MDDGVLNERLAEVGSLDCRRRWLQVIVGVEVRFSLCGFNRSHFTFGRCSPICPVHSPSSFSVPAYKTASAPNPDSDLDRHQLLMLAVELSPILPTFPLALALLPAAPAQDTYRLAYRRLARSFFTRRRALRAGRGCRWGACRGPFALTRRRWRGSGLREAGAGSDERSVCD